MTKTKANTESPAATSAVPPAPPAAVSPIKRYDETFRKNAVAHWIKSGQLPGAGRARPAASQ